MHVRRMGARARRAPHQTLGTTKSAPTPDGGPGLGYFQSQRQNPPRPTARPSAMFLARRAIRRGLPEVIALTLFEILAARRAER